MKKKNPSEGIDSFSSGAKVSSSSSSSSSELSLVNNEDSNVAKNTSVNEEAFTLSCGRGVVFSSKKIKEDYDSLLPDQKEKTLELLNGAITDAGQGKLEKLTGDLKGFYSLRLDQKNRIVFDKDSNDSQIIVHSVLSHYDN
ncbi:MAG TPA: type II toxin-antitoxin system YoeB family toxin [Alphaproteobacteria bacterium]|nr:type II toxin-antitoxin system YoeB family toxin [Alphaproteobacteria bacterium]